jgi:hypothetical protein
LAVIYDGHLESTASVVGIGGKGEDFGFPWKLLKDEGDVIGSKQGHTGDALASAGDEGRDKLR